MAGEKARVSVGPLWDLVGFKDRETVIYSISDCIDSQQCACDCVAQLIAAETETGSAACKSAEVSCSVIYLSAPATASFTKEINVTGDIFIGVKEGVNV